MGEWFNGADHLGAHSSLDLVLEQLPSLHELMRQSNQKYEGSERYSSSQPESLEGDAFMKVAATLEEGRWRGEANGWEVGRERVRREMKERERG